MAWCAVEDEGAVMLEYRDGGGTHASSKLSGCWVGTQYQMSSGTTSGARGPECITMDKSISLVIYAWLEVGQDWLTNHCRCMEFASMERFRGVFTFQYFLVAMEGDSSRKRCIVFELSIF